MSAYVLYSILGGDLMKITKEDKQKIKRLYKSGNYSMEDLGKMFDVSKVSILYIVNKDYRDRLRVYHKENRTKLYKYVRIDALKELTNKLEWLESHNKNYTKEQYYKICEVLDALKKLGGE